jgi:hypothetical protein
MVPEFPELTGQNFRNPQEILTIAFFDSTRKSPHRLRTHAKSSITMRVFAHSPIFRASKYSPKPNFAKALIGHKSRSSCPKKTIRQIGLF